jgi:hypothetical protein
MPLDSERGEEKSHQPHCAYHLEAAAEYDVVTNPRQLLQSELDADAEQQQNHAHLGGARDQVEVADESERERPDEHAGQEVADDRDQSQPAAQIDDNSTDRENRDHLPQERQLADCRRVERQLADRRRVERQRAGRSRERGFDHARQIETAAIAEECSNQVHGLNTSGGSGA